MRLEQVIIVYIFFCQQANAWKNVTFVYDGTALRAKVDDEEQAVAMKGKIKTYFVYKNVKDSVADVKNPSIIYDEISQITSRCHCVTT